MKQQIRLLLTILIATLVGSLTAWADGWESYKTTDYGYTMLIPKGTKMKTKEWSGGWGGLFGTHDGVTLYGVAKLGPPETAEEIEKFGVKLTGIPGDSWDEIDKGEGQGWKWYRSVKATQGSKVFFGGYGVGPKGSYLLLLETTEADFNSYRADYDKWYKSIRLD